MNRPSAWVRRLTGPVVVALLVAGVQQPAFAGPVRRDAPAVPHRAAPKATAQQVKQRVVANPAAAAAVRTPPAVHWPEAAGVELDLTTGGRTTTAGGLQVSAKAVEPAGRTTASADLVPSKVRVGVLDHAAATRARVQGTLLTVSRADGGRSAGGVHVGLAYGGFADAFGGDYGARLHLVELPACVLTTPDRPECQVRTPVGSSNDTAQRQLGATVSAAAAGMTVLAAEPGDTSAQGTYEATKLSPSSKWDVSLSSGALSWSYDVRMPKTPGGLEPQATLSYSSQTVDGRTSATNNQGSWVGEGFTYEPGYIERKYKACDDDGHEHYNDQCWAFSNGSIMLSGHSGDLIKVNDNLWKLSGDDGTKVERKTGATNGDNDGEYWKVTTTGGTEYYFGLNRLPGWSANKDETNSAWTIPVSGDDVNEPCYKSSGWLDSFCDQGWRWNLDYVKDPHGNVISYYYGKELNAYAKGAKTDANGLTYVRGGWLKQIDYGQRDGQVYTTNAPARVRFDTAERCIAAGVITCAEGQLTDDTATSWPDVPWDRNCALGTHCKDTQAAPTFWTRKRLTGITTEIREGSGWTPVEQWTLSHSYTDNGDGSKTLWLDKIDHAGLYGGTATMPPVQLVGIQLPNRIDTDTDMLAPLNRFRLSSVITDTGAQIQVNYAPADCAAGSLPTAGSSTKRCYPVLWNPFGTDDDLTDWFHKYVVQEVIASDPTGGSPDVRTVYEYGNQGFGTQDPIVGAAWRKTDPDGITKAEDLTWSQWRGYPKVTVRTGDLQTLTTKVEHYFLRGMDGDEKPAGAGGGHRSVKVTTDQGTVFTDADELSGTEYETVTYNGAEVISKAVSEPTFWYTQTQTETWGTRHAVMSRTASQRVWTALSPDAQGQPVWRETRTDSTFDQTWGRTVKTDDQGDVGTTTDDVCTTMEYADNGNTWRYDLPKLTEKFSVKCASVTDRATQLMSSDRNTFDGLAYGAAPGKGDITTSESLDTVDATGTRYLATTMTYNEYGRQLTVTDPGGSVTENAYVYSDGFGVRTTVKNPMLQSTATDTSRAFGQATAVIDVNGKRTDLAYDPLGRLISVWLPTRPRSLYPDTPNTKYSYLLRADKPSVISTAKVRNDGTYVTTYQLLDSQLRVRQMQSAGANNTLLLIDTVYRNGKVETQTEPYSVQGVAGDLLLTVPEGSTNGAHKHRYDGADRETADIFTVAGDEKWRTTTSYDGARTSTVPPMGGVPRTSVVDARGHTTELIEYAGHTASGPSKTTQYSFGQNGKVASMTDVLGNVWSYTYDPRGNLIRTDDPDAGTTKFTYDKLNRIATVEDARHVLTSNVYDKLGRLTETWLGKIGVTGSVKQTATIYDSFYKGQVAGTVRYVGSAAYTITYPQRDNLYRVTKTTYTIPADAGTELARTYDFVSTYNTDDSVQGIGMPAAGGLPAENLVFGYDNLQRPLSMTGLNSYVVSNEENPTSYADTGELLRMMLWNGTGKKAWLTFSWERGTNRQTGIRLDRQDIAAVDLDQHYKYDDAGNVLAIADTPAGGPVDTQCFLYDGSRHLTEAWSTATTDWTRCQNGAASTGVGGPAPYHQAWTFDAGGGRLTETNYPVAGPGVTTNYHYAGTGQPKPHTLRSIDQGSAATTTDYTYDERGALLTRQNPAKSESFQWNTDAQLAKYSSDGGPGTTFVYDASGNRLLRKEPGATTLYLGTMQLRLDLATRVVTGTRYYTFAGYGIATRTPSALSWTVADPHNTNSCAIDATTGAITWRRTLPYGGVRGAAPAAWPDDRGFLGGTVDAGGLVHLSAREYDPVIGRFISPDPVLDVDNPEQMNGYGYSGSSPLVESDPNGTNPNSQDEMMNPQGPPPAAPPGNPKPKCSSATPEYCRPKNNKTAYDLGVEWVQNEIAGCEDESKACSTTEYFQDGDRFTEEIQELYTIDVARQIIASELAAGKLYGQKTTDFHLARFTPEEREWNAYNTAMSIYTLGEQGMQEAASFLGSYDLTWQVVGKDANGGPVVEFHLTNASTMNSAKLDKGKVADYGLDQSAGDGHDAKPGEHWLQQSVRWREPFTTDNQPTVHVGTRDGVPWGDPNKRDPFGQAAIYAGLKVAKNFL
ncbi:RHS repeat-associated core domain-containing protein [Dactylosporangium sp. NPDC049525]|uniref:RHS repeat domain-containing protein n=1 Tax=Dactylosporangium sp. NPDC049525 TaxID=3154730 RepID=UPI003435037F